MAKKTKRPVEAKPSETLVAVGNLPKIGPLDSISLRGFKSHKQSIPVALKPLTLLAGGNSSGKSSLMQPLLLLKQTIETPFEPPPLYLGGPIVTLDNAADLFWRGDDGGRVESWSVGLHYGEFFVEVSYRLDPSAIGGLALCQTKIRVEGGKDEAVFRTDMDLDALKEAIKRLGRFDLHLERIDASTELSIALKQARCAHDVSIGFHLPEGSFEPFGPFLPTLPRQFIGSIIHLPGLRDGPERSYAVTGVSGRYPGRFPEYTASLLHHWQEQHDERLAGVVADMVKLALADQIQAQRVNDRRVELRVSRRIGGKPDDMVNIADVGVGVSQVLPIVVALRAAGKDQIVHIEQPELHLHPRAEIALADLFVAAARRGARLVLETHSSTLLRAFQAAVAADDTGWIQKNLALHWFARDDSGESKVTTAEVQADGSFGDWPVDLNVVEMEMTRRLLVASHARRAKVAKESP